MRMVLRIAVGVAVLTALAQAWVTYDWIGKLGDHCDYPDECLTTWLPSAFALAEYLWIVTAIAGVVAVTAAGLLRRPLIDLAVLSCASAAAVVSYLLTPMIQATPGEPIVEWQPVEADPFFWGGPGYTLTALLMTAAAGLFAWQLFRCTISTPSITNPARTPQVADAHRRT